MTRSVKAVLHYAFENLKLNKIEIRCGVGNAKSRAIPERLGFKLDGILRDEEWLYDHFHDIAVYSLLASEWKDSMNEKIRIVPYESTFQEEVVDLIVHIQQKEYNVSITKEEQPDLLEIETFYQKDHGNFWVAIYDGKVVGTVALLDIGNHQVALRKCL